MIRTEELLEVLICSCFQMTLQAGLLTWLVGKASSVKVNRRQSSNTFHLGSLLKCNMYKCQH